MRLGSLLREVLATTWSAKVGSTLMTLVVAGMCFAAIATVGRSASAAAEVTARLEQAGARTLTVVDLTNKGFINRTTVAAIAAIDTVESANGVGAPFDSVNGAVGTGGLRVPTWTLAGDPGSAVEVVRGRTPRPGEAIVSLRTQRRLLLEEPVGFLSTVEAGQQFPIVGAYRAAPSLSKLDDGAVVNLSGRDFERKRELVVVIDRTAAASATVQAVMSILAPPEQDDAAVESPTSLANTARDLERDLAVEGRAMLLLILAVGGLFIAAVVLADVLVRRRDLGRRRTLGVTRADLVAMVTTRCLVTGVLGAGAGCVGGIVVNGSIGYPTPALFALGVGALGVLVAAVAALPPAFYAARLDPVEVMRVA